jgi:Holliday junction resolvase RuvA-like protein
VSHAKRTARATPRSQREFDQRLLGYTPRSTQEKLRVAEALEELPRLAQSLETGSLSWSALRELTRVAVVDTEQEWLALAQGKTVRQLEELVAGKSPGDAPAPAVSASARRHVLRFEVALETFALFREAISCLRRRGGQLRDDDAVLLSMARHVLGGPVDAGRSSYQIALAICPACGAGQQQASGELVSVGAEVIAMARCDGQHLGHVASSAANQNVALRGLPSRETHGNADPYASGDTNHIGTANGFEPDASETANVPGNGVVVSEKVRVVSAGGGTANLPPSDAGVQTLEPPTAKPHTASAHMDAQVQAAGTATIASARSAGCQQQDPLRTRAKQTIPPALRRAVLLRDQHRCQVPGCRNTTFLDLHHIQLRSEGGPNELANILSSCGSHHRAVHRGALLIEKDAARGFRFRHADGSPYGDVLQPQVLEVQTKLFSALRHLGFKEREGRAVLAELLTDTEIQGASLQALLREALRRLRPPQKDR